MSSEARWFFRRKSGYMSPYLLRTVVRIIAIYRRKQRPLDPVFVRVGKRYFMIWKGTK